MKSHFPSDAKSRYTSDSNKEAACLLLGKSNFIDTETATVSHKHTFLASCSRLLTLPSREDQIRASPQGALLHGCQPLKEHKGSLPGSAVDATQEKYVSDDETSRDVWTQHEVVHETSGLRRRPWEAVGMPEAKNLNRKYYVTEAGLQSEKAVASWLHKLPSLSGRDSSSSLAGVAYFENQDIRVVSEDQLCEDSLNAIVGIQSQSFGIHIRDFVYSRRRVRTTNGSILSTLNFLQTIVTAGTYFCRLQRYVQWTLKSNLAGQTCAALGGALADFLHAVHVEIQKLGTRRPYSILFLRSAIIRLSRRMKLLASICSIDIEESVMRAISIPQSTKIDDESIILSVEHVLQEKALFGIEMISKLYAICCGTYSLPNHKLACYMFKAAVQPFLRFLEEWFWDGTHSDPCSEFGIAINKESLTSSGMDYWTKGAVLDPTMKDVWPSFLSQNAASILTCGKSIALLRRCLPTHFLADRTLPSPRLVVSFYPSSIGSIQGAVIRYASEVDRLAALHTEKIQAEAEQAELDKIARHRENVRRALMADADRNTDAKNVQKAKDSLMDTAKLNVASGLAAAHASKAHAKEADEAEENRIQQENDEDEERKRQVTLEEMENIEAEYAKREKALDRRMALTKWKDARSKQSQKREILFQQLQAEEAVFSHEMSMLRVEEEEEKRRAKWGGLVTDIPEIPSVVSYDGDEPVSEQMSPMKTESAHALIYSPDANSPSALPSKQEQERLEREKEYKEGSNDESFSARAGARSKGEQDVMKSLLYPTEEEERGLGDDEKEQGAVVTPSRSGPDSTGKSEGYRPTLSRNPAVYEEGNGMKALLYTDESPAKADTSKEATKSVEPSTIGETETSTDTSMLPSPTAAPDDKGLNEKSQYRSIVARNPDVYEEGNEMKSLIYSENEGTKESQMYEEEPVETSVEPTTSDMQRSTSPFTKGDDRGTGESPVYRSIVARNPVIYEEGNAAKALLYPKTKPSRTARNDTSDAPLVEDNINDEESWPAKGTFESKFGEDGDILKAAFCAAPSYRLNLLNAAEKRAGKSDNGNPVQTLETGESAAPELVIEKCLQLPIMYQERATNTAVLDFFLHEVGVFEHVSAIRKFVLLASGEWAQELVNRLSLIVDKLDLSRKPLKQEIRPSLLDDTLVASLQDSEKHSHRLSFSLDIKDHDSSARIDDIGSLDSLSIGYKAEFPMSIILGMHPMNMYNKIFSLLIKVKRAKWVLDDVHVRVRSQTPNDHDPNAGRFRQLQNIKHEMQHFVTVFAAYLSHQVLDVSWVEFKQDLARIEQNPEGGLDSLIEAHNLYISRMTFRALLTERATPVLKLVLGILGQMLRFRAIIKQNRNIWEYPQAFERIIDTHAKFTQYTTFLYTVAGKLAEQGYQPHLELLILQLDFNQFFKRRN
eukprot:m.69211 g.69211  ORF g.69211 m.69211 type:complete len:1403 (-) comp12033_c0_seq1:70-4278(-)